METTRRDLFKLAGLTGLTAAGVRFLPRVEASDGTATSRLLPENTPHPFRTAFSRPPVLARLATTRDPDGVFVDHYSLTERQGVAHILPGGLTTRVWGYNGITPGPTIKSAQGRRTRLRMRNQLPATHPILGYDFMSSTHLHGSPSLPQYDGYASDITPPGFLKEYHYTGFEPARTLWYHDHAVHHTAQNAYFGLAAQFHVHDPTERRLLPQGEYDVPLIVRDALFDRNGDLVYDDNAHVGLFGDVILVNGRPWPVMRVKRRVYRFRALNASISRSYRFQLDPPGPVTMVGTDDGLMPRSQQTTTWRHGVAERYEFLVDFSRYAVGQRVVLRNLSNPHNIDFADTDKVMAFDVTDAPFDERDPAAHRLPDTLADSESMSRSPSDAVRERTLEFKRQGGEWTINGETWADVVASDFQSVLAAPDLGDVEIWRVVNKSSGWNHPVHIHLIDFKILDRNGRPPFDYERGPKDVVYLGEGETVRLLMKFTPQVGRYMIHCHNLVHEDHDMMHQFAVGWKPGQPDPNDPVNADPPRRDTLPPDA